MSGIDPTADTDFGDVDPTLLPTYAVEWGWSSTDIISWNAVDIIGRLVDVELFGIIGPTADTNTGGINPT